MIRYIFMILVIVVLLLSFVFLLNKVAEPPVKDLSFTHFFNKVESHSIDRVYIDEDKCSGVFKDGQLFTVCVPKDNYDFIRALVSAGVNVIINYASTNFLTHIAFTTLSFLLNILLMRAIFSGMTDSIISTQVGKKEDEIITFRDVAGMANEKRELKEIVESMNNSDRYKKLGCRPPRGLVLFGPPGNGKTLLGRALAGEAGATFFFVSGAEFVEIFVGTGPAKVRNLFKKAREAKRAIIFIDEADSLGNRSKLRNSQSGGSSEHANTINALLKEMDGSDNIVVIFATNYLEEIDPALVRSGRVDREVKIGNPSYKERMCVIEHYLVKGDLMAGVRNGKISRNIDVAETARITRGESRADIEKLINEARLMAARENAAYVGQKHVRDAYEKILVGLPPAEKPTPSELRFVAIHEMGHALVSYFANKELNIFGNKVYLITILPKGDAGGVTYYEQTESFWDKNRSYIESRIMTGLGGRVAEQLFVGNGKITQGCSSDLHSTRAIVEEALILGVWEEEYGLGYISTSYTTMSEYEKTKLNICVNKIINKFHKKTVKILQENRELFNKLVNILCEKETLTGDEMVAIIEGRGFLPIPYKQKTFISIS